MTDGLIDSSYGVGRCGWCGDDALYVSYHDHEWGRPVVDDIRLFEKVCLEGFQAGLSWITILRKRENFRGAFDGFDFQKIQHYGAKDVQRLLGDEGIIRHRGKIEATINNARRAVEMAEEFGTLAKYFWSWEPETDPAVKPQDDVFIRKSQDDIPAVTEVSKALSKDLKKRGWEFVGPTTCYAFMQAMGMVNDHLQSCAFHSVVVQERLAFTRP